MNALPSYLQKDIQHYLASSMLEGLDLFQSLPTSIVGQLALKLKSKSVNIGQRPFVTGDIGKTLYIQRTGKSRLYFANSSQYKVLRRGDVCGEHALLSCKRIDTLQCMTWSEFYTLDVDEIENVLKNNFDAETAEMEWNRIKNTVRASDMRVSTTDMTAGKVLTETRHVQFGSDYFKDAFTSFVEDDLVDTLSAMRAPSETPLTPRALPISSDLITPKASGTPKATPRQRRGRKRPTFRTLQNMFNRSSSVMRNEKVISLHQRDEQHAETPMVYTSPSHFYQYAAAVNAEADNAQSQGGGAEAEDEEEISDDRRERMRIGTHSPTMTDDDECIVLTMKSSTGYGAIPPIIQTPLATIPSELHHTT